MAELECERFRSLLSSRAPRLWGINRPIGVESGLLCQFPGQQVQNGCAASGLASCTTPGGLV